MEQPLGYRIYAPGFVAALPPAYLSIPNFEDCLDIDETSQSHTMRCLPHTKPDKCNQGSWIDIQDSFDGGPCPRKATQLSHIQDHQKCVKPVLDSASSCVLLQPEPTIECTETVHANILEEIFKTKSAIIFPTLPSQARSQDWTRAVPCNQTQDCSNQDQSVQCSSVQSVYGSRGWCTPNECFQDSDCAEVGNVCNEGQISGVCTGGTCNYFPVRLIAECQPEIKVDWERFQYCDTTNDCPDNAKCSAINNKYDSDGNAIFGVCVPKKCSDQVPCPSVGDICSSGAIFGACSSGQCMYDPVIAMSSCQSGSTQRAIGRFFILMIKNCGYC